MVRIDIQVKGTAARLAIIDRTKYVGLARNGAYWGGVLLGQRPRGAPGRVMWNNCSGPMEK